MRYLRRFLPCLTFVLVPPHAASAQKHTAIQKLERDFAAARNEYVGLLGKELPSAYRRHFAKLSKSDMAKVAATRRLWQWYIAEGPFTMGDPRKQRTGIFRREFLDPIDRVAEILLIDPAKLSSGEVRKARAKAFKAAERLARGRKRAGVDPDPTKTKKAPTGIAYPPLDKPHSPADVLRLYERTLVLAKTVAHPGAEEALMKNAEACAEVDLKEADFVMYANQVRMLTGSIVWVCDPLMTACSRDHSNDRKEGKASGHQSKVEGKRFPRDRARRFGCRVGPEGAGGGATGRQAVRGFAYNGTGHGGPLFARLRNVVGPGFRQGALTAVYQTDARLKHDCQATEGELVLPPGVTQKMLKGKTRSAFRAMKSGAFAKAHKSLSGTSPKDKFELALHRYLGARLRAEVDWTLTGIQRILEAGDVYEANERLETAQKTLGGISSFDRRAKSLKARLSKRSVADEIKVGGRYQQCIGAKRKLDRAGLERLIAKHPKSVYAAAAQHCLAAGKNDFWPELFFFVLRDTHLNKWSYLRKDRVGGRR